jgi:hypothetical protein
MPGQPATPAVPPHPLVDHAPLLFRVASSDAASAQATRPSTCQGKFCISKGFGSTTSCWRAWADCATSTGIGEAVTQSHTFLFLFTLPAPPPTAPFELATPPPCFFCFHRISLGSPSC